MTTGHRVVPRPRMACIALLAAGQTLEVRAGGAGAGAALFAWAAADPYEQLSDAYTFMELRRIRPRVGDTLYSTLRRPLLRVARDEAGNGIDLLIHDLWWPRADYVRLAMEAGTREHLAGPVQANWPFAVNLFATTTVDSSGTLSIERRGARGAATIGFLSEGNLVAAIVAAGEAASSIELTLTGQASRPSP